MQDAGWNTMITACQVREELRALGSRSAPLSHAEYRVVLFLYRQLAEAGGVYETIKNIMRVISSEPYNLWPFQNLVRVRKQPSAIIGPNANKTFRDLSDNARAIGMKRLAELLLKAFDDDIRNGIAHADYIIWSDGLRLRRRNGGRVFEVPHTEVLAAVNRGTSFFDILLDHNSSAVSAYNPPKTIIGKLSANFPMPWTVGLDPVSKAFSISGSSPGPQTSPEYVRQVEINARLGGRVLCVFPRAGVDADEVLVRAFDDEGYEPHVVPLQDDAMSTLLSQISTHDLADVRLTFDSNNGLVTASSFGFSTIGSKEDIAQLMPDPLVQVQFDDGAGPSPA